jgi:hypothetical protein
MLFDDTAMSSAVPATKQREDGHLSSFCELEFVHARMAYLLPITDWFIDVLALQS